MPACEPGAVGAVEASSLPSAGAYHFGAVKIPVRSVTDAHGVAFDFVERGVGATGCVGVAAKDTASLPWPPAAGP